MRPLALALLTMALLAAPAHAAPLALACTEITSVEPVAGGGELKGSR